MKFCQVNNYKVLFVINNNILAINIKNKLLDMGIEGDAITPHMLLNIKISNQESEDSTEESRRIKHDYNVDEFDVIIYEEIYFNESHILQSLYRFMQTHSDKIFLANGDENQLPTPQDPVIPSKKAEYINIMFPNYVMLNKCQRCKDGDFNPIKSYINELKEQKFADNVIIQYVIDKFFPNQYTNQINQFNKQLLILTKLRIKLTLLSIITLEV